jgi:hypothetical protein
MKNSEEAIEKVLAGLRDVDAPEGMERRILNSLDDSFDALRDGESRLSRSGWRRVLPAGLRMSVWPMAGGRVIWGVALAGALVLAVAIPTMRRVGRDSVDDSVESTGSVVPGESRTGAAQVEAPPRVNSEAVAKRALQVSTGSHARSMGGVKAQRAVDDLDALALEEMRAASQPAPPLPLTKQERLLLYVARDGAPEELAVLDPVRRAAQDKEERAAVERFFEPKRAEANE